jgi:hypothetical protein
MKRCLGTETIVPAPFIDRVVIRQAYKNIIVPAANLPGKGIRRRNDIGILIFGGGK